jgi:diguanylate cyclase (GGDEF)-like protein
MDQGPASPQTEVGVTDQALVAAAAFIVAALAAVAVRASRRLAAARERCAEAERRADLLQVIADASCDISSLDPDAVLSAVCRATVQAGFDMAEINVADEHLTTLTPVHATGMPDHHIPEPQPITAGMAGLAYTTGETVIIPSYSEWAGGLPHIRELGILGTCGATPVRTEDGIVVILTVAMHDVREVTEFQRHCLQLLAKQAGVALQNARRYDERRRLQSDLAHLAFHDTLTGLGNRAWFLRRLRDRPRTVDSTLAALLFIDLDEFKTANDTLGHEAGDRLLTVVAERLRAGVRPTDALARFGGDEFTVLLDRVSSAAEAEGVARRIMARLTEPLQLDGVTVPVSASIGIALGDHTADDDLMLREADAAMYRAKLLGKRRIELAGALPSGATG